MPTLKMMRIGEAAIEPHPNLLELTDQQIVQLCGLVQNVAAWVMRSPAIVAPYGERLLLIANPFSYWLMNRNCHIRYPVLELDAAEASEHWIADIQSADQVTTTGWLRPESIKDQSSRPTRAKNKRIANRQFCLLCELNNKGRKYEPVPLKVPKDCSRLLKKELPGTLLCPRCGFSIRIPVQQLKQFAKDKMPTSALIRIKYDRNGEPEPCQHCVAKNQEGIKIERMEGDKVIAEYCSNSLIKPSKCFNQSVLQGGEMVPFI